MDPDRNRRADPLSNLLTPRPPPYKGTGSPEALGQCLKRENEVKQIKMFGLAALAALMAMAFVGAGSAMAGNTQLCQSDQAKCTNPVTHVHETTLAGKKAVLKTSLATIECDVLFLSTSVGGLGAPQIIKGNFTYSNCGASCTVTEENGPAEIEVLREGFETGSVVGEGLVHANCFLNCRYNGTGLEGTANGPLLPSTETNGEVTLEEQETNKESGTFCPKTSLLTITTTPLSPVYLSE
jgi:hypothetical protein